MFNTYYGYLELLTIKHQFIKEHLEGNIFRNDLDSALNLLFVFDKTSPVFSVYYFFILSRLLPYSLSSCFCMSTLIFALFIDYIFGFAQVHQRLKPMMAEEFDDSSIFHHGFHTCVFYSCFDLTSYSVKVLNFDLKLYQSILLHLTYPKSMTSKALVHCRDFLFL